MGPTESELGAVALPAGVAETHSGVVFLLGDRAYKLKKRVDLGFLDFRSVAVRRAVCHREVELNRRLAPDVYLGVSDIVDPDGEVCDHLIVMRRMPDERRLGTLVARGAVVDDHLRRLADVLADFHHRADRGPVIDDAARPEALLGRWAANTAGLAPFADRIVAAADVEAVDALARRYLAGRGPLFEQRIADGRACDGHGDLLADDVFCLDDGPRVLDCIEFDDDLRYGDVLADVAFLAMDLERLGRPDLADRFLDDYRRRAADHWPASLAHHHIGYRAQVRAKVAAIRADQGHQPSAETARRCLALARRHLDAGRVRLILVGGLPGTGKSTLARGLGEALGAVVVRSDVIRKELAGLPAHQDASSRFGEGLYGAASTAATYAELLERAGSALRTGESVVLDASWTDQAARQRARQLARETASEVVELRCVVPGAVAERRIGERARKGRDASDADAAVARRMAAVVDPWPEATEVDTTAERGVVLSGVLPTVGAV
jgi:uncharacterized protein